MKDNYTYQAIFDYSEEGFINIEFPMFEGAFSCVGTDENPICCAQDLLVLYIQDYIDSNKTLPQEKEYIDLDCTNKNKVSVYINIWLPYHTRNIKETYVKKTLTIPTWLDLLAKQNNINFSSTLTDALKLKLNIR